MKEKIKKIIEYIEQNYHEVLTLELIENITGNSVGYFRNEFSKIVRISLDKYRIRRSLTLIINEIKQNNSKIIEGNVLPWKNNRSFYEAFKKEFGVTPKEYMKDNNIKLQDKFNIDELIEEDRLIKSLVRKCGNYEKALIYLLKLPAYKTMGLRYFCVKDDEELYEHLVWNYYRSIEDEIYNDKVYKEHKRNIKKYYALDQVIEFHQNTYNFEDDDMKLNLFDGFMTASYFVVKRSLLLNLINLIDFEKFFRLIKFEDIKTIWHYEIISKKNNIEDGMVCIPNDFIGCSEIKGLNWDIVHEIIIRENGYDKIGKDFESFKEYIKYNYDKPIESEDVCDYCRYKEIDEATGECKFSDDSNCKGYDNLTVEDKERFFKEEYELLTIDELFRQIIYLFYIGILFL